jgi:hypothetical protein
VPVPDDFYLFPADELGEGCVERWERLTDDRDIRWVGARKITLGEFPYWSVVVGVAEFLREDPLESELRQQMDAALRAVAGAERVWEDDREAWGVAGAASGEALLRAAAGVVDHLADRARAYIDSLG